MIRSMTGFGRSEVIKDNKKFTVEIKSVNHRYLDISIKIPKKFNYYEALIRNLLKKYIERGKVDIYITYEDLSESDETLQYNPNLAKEYFHYLEQMGRELKIENDIKVSTLLNCQDIFTKVEEKIDEETVEPILTQAFCQAAENFVHTRQLEGENLQKDLLEKLSDMSRYVSFITERSPEIITNYRMKLQEKVKEMLQDKQIEESRIITEVTLFADKICVDEETVRLNSHIKAMQDALNNGDAIGRKLDFVAQEMNREANTILSKSNDLQITDTGIELKTMIEKIREQVQNIE